ncbi:MAG: hypothetical protein PHV53_02840 [Fermentimonas sp.]|nr:hypothetical protein [Fermentimonas sp.]
MLVEVSKRDYRRFFPVDFSPFVSEAFIALNEYKQDEVVRLIRQGEHSVGLLAGLKGGVMKSPFSAPFGGFHYTHEHLAYELIYDFLSDLKEYLIFKGIKKFSLTLPPNLYQVNMNAKIVNAMIRLGYRMELPDLNNWVDLKQFDGTWTKSVVAQNCRKAIKHRLEWSAVTDMAGMKEVYRVIERNRMELGRKIYMTLEDIIRVKEVFPVDFFIIREVNGNCVGGAVLYRGHESIIQGIFMGSDLEKRNLGIIDYMYMNIYDYYKELGFDYIDMGTSSLNGEANPGLLRFKEIHNSVTSLRYTFTWEA